MTTALGVPEGAWRDDGSNSIEDLGSSFRVRPVRHVSAPVRPPRGPVNALFAVPLESASYFEVTCKEFSGAPFVGIATEAGLAPGYKCKGLFYGGPGNLSDGSAALRTNFGDEVHQGDVIGVLIQRDGARLRMILYHNARCLGTAFETSTESTIYPVVQAKDEGDLFSIDFKEAPTSQTRQIADGKSGQWKLEQVLYPELLEVPLKIRCLLTVREEKEIGLVLKVVNLLRFQGSEETERLTIEGYSSTMMAGPEDLMELEHRLAAALKSIRQWTVTDNSLLLTGPGVQILCARADPEMVTTATL